MELNYNSQGALSPNFLTFWLFFCPNSPYIIMDKHGIYVEDTFQEFKTLPVFTMCLFVCLR